MIKVKTWLTLCLTLLCTKLESMMETKVHAEQIETEHQKAASYDAVPHPAWFKRTQADKPHKTEKHPAQIRPRLALATASFPQVCYDRQLVIYPKNSLVVLFSRKNKLMIWDSAFGDSIRISTESSPVFATWSPDGNWITINGKNCEWYDYQLKKTVAIKLHTPFEHIAAAAFSPNSHLLLTANTDIFALKNFSNSSAFLLRLWPRDGQQELCSTPTHEYQPEQNKTLYDGCKVAFHPDGCHFVVGLFEKQPSADQNGRKITLQYWEIIKAGKEMRKVRKSICFSYPKNYLHSIEFNQDGSLLLTHVTAGVIIWDVPTFKIRWALKNDNWIAATFDNKGEGIYTVDRKGAISNYKMGFLAFPPELPLQGAKLNKNHRYSSATFSLDKRHIYLLGGKLNIAGKFESVTPDTLFRATLSA